ncbi:hypothetical protein APE_2541 [Aeropyrum pernix K1]|uniref:Uncharacterized protein n=1 Tax=Aeropyrum pernix (strain ATCC 700893 / DSM 11879 / JCM 9820 / NBRC 100138 / K1) TaxID=272557 RepID=Q9Y8U2_AERPE|nr:hypothetical protein APE_2541 [Aeropyrum pernix K1]
MLSWVDVYRSLWRLASKSRGRLGDAFLDEVESYLAEALEVLADWRPARSECRWIPSLARELRILSRILSSDVMLEAREYGLESSRVERILMFLSRLEAEADRLASTCENS